MLGSIWIKVDGSINNCKEYNMNMKIADIKPNPDNPRTIKDDNFKKLVQSIKDFPEMLDARPLVLNKENVILGGNMRFKAAKEAGLKELPVKIVDWSEDKQKEFIIKDNVSGGEWDWDTLANEWDTDQLELWGVDVFKPQNFNENDDWSEIDDFETSDNSLKLVIQFETEEARQQFLTDYPIEIRTKGKNTYSTWYPYKERNDFSDAKIQ